MRSIPAYENAVKECFERCLDLYLCPRVQKKRPYPVACYLEYTGHEDAVTSVSVEASGQWIASGSLDGTLRIWEFETGRCVKICDIDLLLLNTGCGTEEVQKRTKELLSVEMPMPDDSASSVSWLHDDKLEGIRLTHSKTVASGEWHRKGDYLSTVMPAVTSVFHPTRSFFLISTKKIIRVYDQVKDGKLVKKLETGLREVSSTEVHPSCDHIIVESREGKLCGSTWTFHLNLTKLSNSDIPRRVHRLHQKDINNVSFHRWYPLFATCSDDCTAYVFHGMVYSDLNQNPLIVPLEIPEVKQAQMGEVYCTVSSIQGSHGYSLAAQTW
ncbi:ribosome biogenesis protein BOP1-like protein [Pyrus ussuriensis x Pyrus communis]|uniref:Ribosome biogenesis protein BOP1-like protein n=1 Tax=Pyrus ussuriensis x Pyrus communis TaxID=2448454 RepID=A0A5N5I925_9ROSA|nr:ribosome biogenesis protein BOP1-like protein [Pyrus ussuriensis x Pyrus communis]